MTNVELHEHSVKNVSFQPEEEFSTWHLRKFKKALQIRIVKVDNDDLEFDIIGIHCSFVNAFRRVLLAEVPMMAIEKVYVHNNTSIIQDEVLSHRLGLIPLKADPRKFNSKKADEDDLFSAEDTLEFHLKVKCERSNPKSSSVKECFENCRNIEVLSEQIEWIPFGHQSTLFKNASEVGPVDDKILIARLRPGHELNLKMYAVRGIGRDHAKFQPVATVSYRLLPRITLLRDVEGEQAQRLKSSFSPDVIELERKKGKLKARVANARLDSCSRNFYRHEDLRDCVALSRVPDHYIFTIESIGALPPDVLFVEAIKVLKDKCNRLLDEIEMNGERSFL